MVANRQQGYSIQTKLREYTADTCFAVTSSCYFVASSEVIPQDEATAKHALSYLDMCVELPLTHWSVVKDRQT